jgi:hypothetical protein
MQTFDKNERITVAAYLNEYKGTNYLHIREHYTDKAGELKPTKKGIAIDFELAAELLACLTAVIGDAKNAPQAKPATPAKPAKAKAAKAKPAAKPAAKGKATGKRSPALDAALAAIPAKS